MAKSGTFYGKYGNYQYLYLKCDWSATQDVGNNRSTVELKTYLCYYALVMSSKTLSESIGGSSRNTNVAAINDTSSGQKTRLISTYSVVINHNNDGTKNGVTLSASLPVGYTDSSAGVYISKLKAEETVNLDAIPRNPSTFTISPSVFTIGDTVTINIYPNNASYTHNIYIQRNDGSYDAVATGVGTSYSWNTTEAFFTNPSSKLLTSSQKKYTANILIKTMKSGVQIGEDVTQSFTANLAESASTKPIISNFSKTPVRSVLYQCAVGVSSYDISFNVAAQKYATIASVRVEVDGKVYTPTPGAEGLCTVSADPFVNAGPESIVVTVKDSREFPTTYADNEFFVFPYSKPYIAPLSGLPRAECYRATQYGAKSPSGDHAYLKFRSVYSELPSPGNINDFKVEWRSCQDGGSWGSWNTLIPFGSGAAYQTWSGNISGATFTTLSAFTLELKITDLAGATSSVLLTLPAESIPLHLKEGGTGIGLGRYADPNNNDRVMVGWDAYFDGDVHIKVNGSYMTLSQYIQSIVNP